MPISAGRCAMPFWSGRHTTWILRCPETPSNWLPKWLTAWVPQLVDWLAVPALWAAVETAKRLVGGAR